MVVALADWAVCHGFAVVHAVVDRLERAQIRKEGLQIVVVHLPEKPPWHDGANVPRAYLARPHDLQEHGFVVITDTGRIRCQIRAGHLEIRFYNQGSACELQPGKWFTIRVSKGMAPFAGTQRD